MREVSSKALDPFEHAANAHGLRLEDLVAGSNVTLAQRRDPVEWIDWDVVAELATRFERATSREATVEMGRRAVSMELVGPLRRIAGVALNLRLIYRAGITWQLPLLYRNVATIVDESDPSFVRLEVSIPRHQRGSSAWFRYLHGGLEALPTLCGREPVQVEADISEHRASYSVPIPATRRIPFALLRSIVGDPAREELERQVAELRLVDAERSRVDAALRDRERMLSNLIANLSGIVYRCRADDFGFDFVSDRCVELTGYRVGELVDLHRDGLPLVVPVDVDRVVSARRASLASQQPCSIEYRIETRWGDVRWVLDVSRGVYDPDGRPTAMEGFLTDITERHRLEEQLSHALRVEGIGRLAGGIAHDFNNLLSVILGASELTRRLVPPGGRAVEYVEHVVAAAERGAQLTRQLLAVARKQVIEPRVVDLNALVLGMDPLLRRTLPADIEVACALADGVFPVLIDPGQFEQVLLNLAINARDAMPKGGTLTIETANMVVEEPVAELPDLGPGVYATIAVSDTGIGMDEDMKQRAFEPFFTTKGPGRGSGLGLASSHGIVRQAQGQIYVSSEPGRGASFRIYLPRSTATAATDEREVHRVAHGCSETVLVVDDHAVLRAIVVESLETQGYRVLDAASGDEAIGLLARHTGPLDLLLTDVVMPQMNGSELAEYVLRSNPSLPVLFMSGYTERNVLEVHRGAGFLAKPFTPQTLVVKVREILDRAASRPESEVRASMIRLVQRRSSRQTG